jgi:hypothetical protein
MKQAKKHSIVVWENRTRRSGNVIPLADRGAGSREGEATVTEWQVGTEQHSAKVTMVSSGFGEGKAASTQMVSMRFAA